MKFYISVSCSLAALAALMSLTNAILVQPYNYMLDDSSLVDQQDAGSLSPFHNDQGSSGEHAADKDIVSIIGERLARLRHSRMLENQDDSGPQQGHFSQEMAELIEREQQASRQGDQSEQSLPASVAGILMNVAQAADQAAEVVSSSAEDSESGYSGNNRDQLRVTARGAVPELDTSPAASVPVSLPSKADLKTGPIQWYNPKETIPVLKISSMATPSKYKKVYFRSEKKLVDGAFHSQEQDEKKSLIKPFNSGVQRRSSRGTASSAPPSPFQDGVIEFLRKFRDVYIQTRPVSTASGSSASSLASSMVSAAASSPLASVLAPSGSRPNLASALSAASSIVAQAAASGGSSGSGSGAAAAAANGVAASGAAGAIKSPLTAQSYVSFWSKTFPTWVKKMLKQMRRRSLYNSKRQQQMHHSATSALGHAAQAAASSAVATAVEAASGSSGARSGSTSH